MIFFRRVPVRVNASKENIQDNETGCMEVNENEGDRL